MRYSFKAKDRSLPLYVDSIGYKWRQEHVSRPKGYNYVHWLQTYSGIGIVNIEGRDIELKENQGILINQNIPHDYHSKNGEWLTGYFSFGGLLISEITKTLGFRDFLYIESPEEKLRDFISVHHKEFKENNRLDIYESSTLVYEFLLLIKKYNVVNPHNYQMNKNIIDPNLNMIRDYYQKDLTNNDFVQATNYSLQYILEAFRNNYGSSPHQILIDYRIKKAKEILLNEPTLSVEEVGRNVGFNTNSYFISMFKRGEGVTPGKFRGLYK
ncbi:AraC family transcriptional regulator [Companilactobacillus sp. HBUAS56257]|uniref:AraC family transcriptional regulator n=1 Tax=Companilactobacillus sp. HBUAS56257 TaxID=3109360 RepID=UPI002FF008BF